MLAALERSRSGRMRDIVATVQAEQDEVIRAELPGVLVVQGGPGTGKTAIALHRAAYLLYTYRFPLERQGVLVVGPNPVYLRYIEHVLPSLGETGVVLTTVEGLLPHIRPRTEEGRKAARVKGDARMATVLARAVRDRQRFLRHGVDVGVGAIRLRLDVEISRRAVTAARRRAGTHNPGRRQVEAVVARLLHEQYERAVRGRGWAPGEGPLDEAELWQRLSGTPEVQAALDRMWPLLRPEELLHDLFGAPPLLRLAAGGVLDEGEQSALQRARSTSFETIPWTPADVALFDEARALLGPRRSTGPDTDEPRTYGHVVVDEVQDLTPMELRMLARRSLSGSMTVVGDIAQATGPLAPSGWEEVTAQLPDRRPARVAELTVNYRTPADVMEVAHRVLAVAAPGLRPPHSVRVTGTRPVFLTVATDGLGEGLARAVRHELAEVEPGTVAVIAPPSMVEGLARALEEAEVPFARPDRRGGLVAPVSLLSVGMVKGLEFDAVVVVEPSRVVTEAPQGLRALYVALTRPTSRLTVVHAEPLPEALL